MLNAARLADHPTSSGRDLEVALPPGLAGFGGATRARLTGPARGRSVVVLGGISGDRLVCPEAASPEAASPEAFRAEGAGWWPGLVGEGAAVDPRIVSVLGVDFAADESGAAAPTTAQQAAVVIAAMDAAGIRRAALVGASYGGMVALSLAAAHPERVERVVVISADAAPHPMATALRELQRRIVALGLDTGRAADALAIARGLAMLSYRTGEEFGARFACGLDTHDPLGVSAPGAYLRACGDAFVRRMSPGRFLSLSASIDRHRVDPSTISAPALLIGASSDQLVPPAQMETLAARLVGPAVLHMLDTRYGHDMFLKEAARVGALVAPFLAGRS